VRRTEEVGVREPEVEQQEELERGKREGIEESTGEV
jgi:hypothetical protein